MRQLTIGLALLLAGGGCAVPGVDRTVETRAVAVETRAPVEWVFEVRAAAAPARLPANADELVILNTVASVIAHDLKLPLPNTVLAVAYANEAMFADGLARRGVAPEQARDAVRGTVAVAVGTSILLRADLLSHAPVADRAGRYAHELAHVAQSRLVGRRDVATWILEGHAEWVQHRVVDILEYRTYAQARDEVRREVVRSKTPRDQFPPLSAIETPMAWRQAARRFGWTPTYGQAFLAVDWLVERYTEDRLRAFVRAPDRPPRVNPARDRDDFPWSGIFPISYRGFLAEFRAYLQALQ